MSEKIKIDIGKYPIIIISTNAEPDSKEIEIFGQELEELLLSKEGEFVIVSDPSNDVSFPVNIRIQLGKTLNYISGKFSSRELAVYIVIQSAFSRMMMSCIGLVAKNNKLRVVSSLDEGLAKAKEKLENSTRSGAENL
jgi:hypothetical protein